MASTLYEEEDYKYSNPKMKYTDAVIQGITILKSKNASADIKEAAGDAANYPDAVAASAKFSDLQTELEAAVGEKVEMPFLFCNSGYKGFAANCGISVQNPYAFSEAGTYTVDVEIEGVFSGKDNHRIEEAFNGNNYLKNAGTVTVK